MLFTKIFLQIISVFFYAQMRLQSSAYGWSTDVELKVQQTVQKYIYFSDHNNSTEKMEVVIEQGVLKGVQNKTLLSNKPYVSFLGIPYAKPPVNDLRFKVNNFVPIIHLCVLLLLTSNTTLHNILYDIIFTLTG